MAWLKRHLGKIVFDYKDGHVAVEAKLDDRQYDPNSLSDLVVICGSVVLSIVEEFVSHLPADKRPASRAVCLVTVGRMILSSVLSASNVLVVNDTSWTKSNIEA